MTRHVTRGIAGAVALLSMLAIAGCSAAPSDPPASTPDPREAAIAILEGSAKSASPYATDEQLADTVARAVDGLEQFCVAAAAGKDPHSTVVMPALEIDLVMGAEKVLRSNDVDICAAFGS